MSTQLRKLVELRKTQLINKLLQAGIYKSSEKQLYELSVSELEKECQVINHANK
ncbi:Fur-regulated basic protein FbpA [Virgibacillus sp. 6R]|uniref:Fur-regulated basic protein FbpA n=1 Tax=Metabacillus sp. 22489 TaxID=3453928 RepID=UPI0011A3BAF4